MPYVLSKRAEEDVINIYAKGTALFGLEQAESYFAALMGTFDILGAYPMIARERREIDPPVRIHPHGAHIIVYTISEDGGTHILRVRHGRENWSTNDTT
ncbi:MAG: type II toxin-antitoxin system RelE/ParE family toxin [Aquisalinus sp.]|nr:type II toxin-antitoxin system RelE/ParE family toxin [Aquisalinus sp.]